MSLVFFFLRLDRIRYQRFFWLAAAAAGVTLGIKYLGGFFVLVVPLYLYFGIRSGVHNFSQAAWRGLGFVAVMLAAFVVSNPLLLLPQERAEIIATQRQILGEASQGILVTRPPFLENGWLPQWLTNNLGGAPFLILLLAALAAGSWKKERRAEALLLAAWLLPNLVAVFSTASSRIHYWLPLMLPAITALAFVLPERPAQLLQKPLSRNAALQIAAVAIVLLQALSFANHDHILYTQTLQREELSPSLQFYGVAHPVLADWQSAGQELRVYRDWKVYFPSEAGISVFMDWELASHELLAEKQPDVLLLERENVRTYGAEDYLSASPDPERLQGLHRFYRDALLNQLDGYRLLFKDQFGLIFVRE